MKIIIATIKSWNIERAYAMQKQYEGIHQIEVFTKKEELTLEAVEKFAPDYIFLPHWSYLIAKDITRMIPVFLEQKPTPVPQEGEPVIFKRRKPEESRLTEEMPLDKIYDYIRMLDAEGYPRAYMDFGPYRLEFEQAQLSSDFNELEAKVKIHIREE